MAVTKKHTWLAIGLLGTLIAAPNGTVIKYAIGSTDPYFFNALRFALIAAITTPFIFTGYKRITKKNFRLALFGGLYMAAAVVSYVWAIKLSAASYVSIITLLSPLIFIFYSSKMAGERISRRGLAGITLAALGAMVIIVLPVAVRDSGSFTFYPMATLFALINTVTFPLTIIYFRKANEEGLTMNSVLSLSSWVVTLVNLGAFLIFLPPVGNIDGSAIFGTIYSGVLVGLVARAISVEVYEHIGSVISSALSYLETFIAILLPLFVLHEHLSPEVVLGGILILAGVYVAQHHRQIHPKHRHLLRVT